MESSNGRLRLDVDLKQIERLVESLVNKGYQVCCDWDWHQITQHETIWYFIFDRENHRFLELYYDDKTWVLQESKDLITRKVFPDRGEQPWKNIHSTSQLGVTTKHLTRLRRREASSTE